MLLLVFLGANWTTIFLSIEERCPGVADVASSILAFDNVDDIVNTLIAIAFVMLAFFLVSAIFAARRIARKPKILLVSSNQPPELTLSRHMKWHLFNSHIWSTGQDAAAVIKNQLKLLLPGINVFLDVRSIGSATIVRPALTAGPRSIGR